MNSSTIPEESTARRRARWTRACSALQLLDTGVTVSRAADAMGLTVGQLAALVRPARVRITGRRPWTAGARASAAAESYALGRLARGQSLTSVAAETGLAFELVRALAALS